jgi:collagenase-like PrtC family protease
MKYLVASNWDLTLLDKIDHPEVQSLFGGLPDTVISSGRPSSQICSVSEGDVRRFIAQVHAKHWEFDYNVNSPCLANLEVTQQGFKKVMKHLEKIADWGVDAVTITNTNLIGLVKKNFPKLKINLSTYQRVSNVAQARRFEDLGVDLIMLSEHINRDFDTLHAIRKAIRCQLALIANVGCVYNCANLHTHPNSSAHAGTKGETRLFNDPFMMYCFGRRLSSPEEVIRIRWIRPEDVGYYEDLGIDMLKIVDRNTQTDALAKRVVAYCQRSYDGNLLEMLGQMVDLKQTKGQTRKMLVRGLLARPGLNSLRRADKMKRWADLFSHSLYDLVHLDNKSLPADFVRSFAERDCRSSDCRTCGNCKRWADRAVRIPDAQALAETRQRLDAALEEIRAGTSLF